MENQDRKRREAGGHDRGEGDEHEAGNPEKKQRTEGATKVAQEEETRLLKEKEEELEAAKDRIRELGEEVKSLRAGMAGMVQEDNKNRDDATSAKKAAIEDVRAEMQAIIDNADRYLKELEKDLKATKGREQQKQCQVGREQARALRAEVRNAELKIRNAQVEAALGEIARQAIATGKIAQEAKDQGLYEWSPWEDSKQVAEKRK